MVAENSFHDAVVDKTQQDDDPAPVLPELSVVVGLHELEPEAGEFLLDFAVPPAQQAEDGDAGGSGSGGGDFHDNTLPAHVRPVCILSW